MARCCVCVSLSWSLSLATNPSWFNRGGSTLTSHFLALFANFRLSAIIGDNKELWNPTSLILLFYGKNCSLFILAHKKCRGIILYLFPFLHNLFLGINNCFILSTSLAFYEFTTSFRCLAWLLYDHSCFPLHVQIGNLLLHSLTPWRSLLETPSSCLNLDDSGHAVMVWGWNFPTGPGARSSSTSGEVLELYELGSCGRKVSSFLYHVLPP